ncbi:MAG: sigma-54 dependent transcriptional regulator [Candidatus Omnitrophica bacterium]|nr:MAG: Transcriptional regulatory protein ZraR [Candidatus Hinthialibacteria bacterium OLB16]MBE7487709.1 sigma-54-dependent Fis family transcriptional regulator [bacterium]MCC6733869.1 sigma-54-dependent Fis family transcriptional regulator [Candidatus Omnitrophota bacterium]MCE7908366.1 sigma-54-dependent Fis family transcriptional regulator [Candidatus Omnitrophica bacterium COP1]MBV6481072.1 Regulatory protein AtoC [bacterium]
MPRILIVDDESGIRSLLSRVLGKRYETREAANGREALNTVGSWPPDIIICDLKMPEMSGLEVLRALQEQKQESLVIVLTAHGTVETAVEAMKLGAFDYLRKPFDVEEVLVVVEKALSVRDLKEEVRTLRKQVQKRNRLDQIIGHSPLMLRAFDLIEQVAPTRSTVLIIGESGTGKELIARALHVHSPRAEKRFVAVNCAAISEELLESELFGHEKGSFTGAISSKVGKFELAHGGTLFLDEISEMSPRLQAKLLRVLQEGEIDKVGGSSPIPVDVRILASTNRNLREEIKNGSFREDLFYRLNVVTITFPPLRERKEDIPLLAEHFCRIYEEENGHPIQKIPEETLRILMRYNWPGNVRELENTIERASILCRNGVLTPDCLPEEILNPVSRPGLEVHVGMSLEEAERTLILETLKACGANRSKAVDLLGISIRTLRNKLTEYRETGVEVP